MLVINKGKRQDDFFGTCGECQTGWSCCLRTRPPISGNRRQIIIDYIKEHGIGVEDAFVQEEYTYPREHADGYCVFRDDKTWKCVIHAVKPETCVAGPITFDINVKTGKIEWFLKMDKLCQLAGVVGKDKKLLDRHFQAARTELLKLVKDLDPQALKAILEKDEPETFKFSEHRIDRNVLDKLR